MSKESRRIRLSRNHTTLLERPFLRTSDARFTREESEREQYPARLQEHQKKNYFEWIVAEPEVNSDTVQHPTV